MGGVLQFHQGNQGCLTFTCCVSDTHLPLFILLCVSGWESERFLRLLCQRGSCWDVEWEEAAGAGEEQGKSRLCLQWLSAPRTEVVLSGNSHLDLSCSSLWVMHSSFWLSQVQSFILLLFQFLYYLCNEFPMLNFLCLSYLGGFCFPGWIMRHTAGGIESRLKGCEGQAMGITEETVFQVEGRASSKALW